MKKLFSIVTILALAALPLAAQTEPIEEPIDEESTFEADADIDVDVEGEVDEDVEFEADLDDDVEFEAELDEDFDDEDELPRTASPLALIALLGGASATAAWGVRRLRK